VIRNDYVAANGSPAATLGLSAGDFATILLKNMPKTTEKLAAGGDAGRTLADLAIRLEAVGHRASKKWLATCDANLLEAMADDEAVRSTPPVIRVLKELGNESAPVPDRPETGGSEGQTLTYLHPEYGPFSEEDFVGWRLEKRRHVLEYFAKQTEAGPDAALPVLTFLKEGKRVGDAFNLYYKERQKAPRQLRAEVIAAISGAGNGSAVTFYWYAKSREIALTEQPHRGVGFYSDYQGCRRTYSSKKRNAYHGGAESLMRFSFVKLSTAWQEQVIDKPISMFPEAKAVIQSLLKSRRIEYS
jgi:hypothetical protein